MTGLVPSIVRRAIDRVFHQLGLHSLPQPALIPFRQRANVRAAVLFVHGFGGDTQGTWGRFPNLLAAEPQLRGWDVFALGYPSSLRIDVRGLWDADPDLTIASLSLRTALSVAPLAQYQSIAIVAHSMGGLVAQHALLDDTTVRRIGHLVLFGCPSAGLKKALIGAVLKRQARDMVVGSDFLISLRKEWNQRFEKTRTFSLSVIAGERDEFVPAESSLKPFPKGVCRAVPGNHAEIVKPQSQSDRSVQVVVGALCGNPNGQTSIDSALVAVELRDFAYAVEVLLPRAHEIDDAALVQLALALEGLGRGKEALELLEEQCSRRGKPSTDALGVLAGRLKRRWLTERVAVDWERARSLYLQALRLADASFVVNEALETGVEREVMHRGEIDFSVDREQAMYHAINIAFLDLMSTPPASSVPPSARHVAERALAYAQEARDDHWRSATRGDAMLMLGSLKEAGEAYRQAVAQATSPREIDSMYAQAIRIAERIYGESGVREVEDAFGVGPASTPGGT